MTAIMVSMCINRDPPFRQEEILRFQFRPVGKLAHRDCGVNLEDIAPVPWMDKLPE